MDLDALLGGVLGEEEEKKTDKGGAGEEEDDPEFHGLKKLGELK